MKEIKTVSKRIVLLQALAATPNDLRWMLKSVKASDARRRPTHEAWSIADVVNHLADVEARYLERLQRIVVEERPFLPWMHPDEVAHDGDASLPDLLARFGDARAATLAYLQSLPPGSWQRPAVHETLGETKLRFMVQTLVNHDTEHLSQIVEIQQALRTIPDQEAQPAIPRRD